MLEKAENRPVGASDSIEQGDTRDLQWWCCDKPYVTTDVAPQRCLWMLQRSFRQLIEGTPADCPMSREAFGSIGTGNDWSITNRDRPMW